MRYSIDVKLTGYEQVVVDAENEEEAYDKALDRFWEIYDTAAAKSLRCKTTTMTIVNKFEQSK